MKTIVLTVVLAVAAAGIPVLVAQDAGSGANDTTKKIKKTKKTNSGTKAPPKKPATQKDHKN